MKTLSSLGVWGLNATKRFAPLVIAASAALACSPEFTPSSKIGSLRILAVQKNTPYAKPGGTVELTMLYANGSQGAKPGSPPINVLWITGCENPPGDVYSGCFVSLAGEAGAALTGTTNASFVSQFHVGPQISYSLSSDIISRRPKPANPHQIPYGLSYAFFAACTGDIRPTLDAPPSRTNLPLACYGPNNEQLGADQFVVGYTAVYAYDDPRATNANPTITGFQIDGNNVPIDCIDDGCVAVEQGPPSAPGSDGGSDARAEATETGPIADSGLGFLDGGDASFIVTDAGPRRLDAGNGGSAPPSDAGSAAPSPPIQSFPVCTNANDKDCPQHTITPLFSNTKDHPTVEVDQVIEASNNDGKTTYEQAWIDYYADAGSFTNDVKLLGDAINGFIDDHTTQLRVPQQRNKFHIWAVAHDSRGGVSFVEVPFQVY